MQDELCIVADIIKKLRESRGMTQEQLAEKADVSLSHIAKIETHVRTVGMKTYLKLLNAMEIPVEEHFSYISRDNHDFLLNEKIWYLFKDCDEKEISLLLCSIEGVKKGLKEYRRMEELIENDAGESSAYKRRNTDSPV